jgi:hypothetical protein
MHRPRFELDPSPKNTGIARHCCANQMSAHGRTEKRQKKAQLEKIKLVSIAGHQSHIRTTDLVTTRHVSAQPTCRTEETGGPSAYTCLTECTRSAETETRFTKKDPLSRQQTASSQIIMTSEIFCV